jgi:hypothetical protein
MWPNGQLSVIALNGAVKGEKPTFHFTAPACEPAYDFKVAMYCWWQPSRRRWSARWPADAEEFAKIYEIVRAAVRLISREFSIFAPAKAEQAVNERLIKELDTERSTALISPGWTARAEFGLPEQVRELMRKTLDEEYRIRTKAQAAKLLMSETGEVRQGWDHFLNDAAESRNGQHAVRLAEDPTNLAQALAEVLQDRRKGAENLLNLIDKIVEAQRSADILDLVVQSETVLHQTLKMMGIPLPEAERGTLLEQLEENI